MKASLPIHPYAYGPGPEDPMELPDPTREDMGHKDLDERVEIAVDFLREAARYVPQSDRFAEQLHDVIAEYEREGWGE